MIVKKGQLEGRKFRRQHSVGSYVLDFYCPAEKLGIELDGEVHFNERAIEHDRERRLFLEYFGIRVLRFENRAVFDEPELVVETIYRNFGWKETTTPAAEPATPPLKGGEPS